MAIEIANNYLDLSDVSCLSLSSLLASNDCYSST